MTGTGARVVYNMRMMSSIDSTRKRRSTYEAFSNRPCYDESKCSSDVKQSKSKFHDEQRFKFDKLKEQ